MTSLSRLHALDFDSGHTTAICPIPGMRKINTSEQRMVLSFCTGLSEIGVREVRFDPIAPPPTVAEPRAHWGQSPGWTEEYWLRIDRPNS